MRMRDGTRTRRRNATSILALAVVLSLVVAVPVLAFKSGTYSGTTSQEDTAGDPKPLQLKVNRQKSKVTIVFFELEAPPCGGTGGLQYAGGKTAIRASGKFKWVNEPYGYVKGQFQHNEASGTALYEFAGAGCNSGEITWTAERTSPP
jgi:hypothetical protein